MWIRLWKFFFEGKYTVYTPLYDFSILFFTHCLAARLATGKVPYVCVYVCACYLSLAGVILHRAETLILLSLSFLGFLVSCSLVKALEWRLGIFGKSVFTSKLDVSFPLALNYSLSLSRWSNVRSLGRKPFCDGLLQLCCCLYGVFC